MREAIQQAVSFIHNRYFDQITLSGLASEVFVSPYHFSRIFSRATGVTPGQYLSAVRLFEAKRLLLTTSLTVSDIVCSVGYNSVGTFTSRFTRAVGMPPTQYRHPEVRKLVLAVSPEFQRLPPIDLVRAERRRTAAADPESGSIRCTLELPPSADSVNVLMGVFADPIPQCAPIACHVWNGANSAELTIRNVPDGRWVVIAVAERAATSPQSRTLLIGKVHQPVMVAPGSTADVHVRMRELQPTDPPIAITLASRVSLQQIGDKENRYYAGRTAA